MFRHVNKCIDTKNLNRQMGYSKFPPFLLICVFQTFYIEQVLLWLYIKTRVIIAVKMVSTTLGA